MQDCARVSRVPQKFMVYRDQVLDSLRANAPNDQIVILYKLMYENKSTAGACVSVCTYACVAHSLHHIHTPHPLPAQTLLDPEGAAKEDAFMQSIGGSDNVIETYQPPQSRHASIKVPAIPGMHTAIHVMHALNATPAALPKKAVKKSRWHLGQCGGMGRVQLLTGNDRHAVAEPARGRDGGGVPCHEGAQLCVSTPHAYTHALMSRHRPGRSSRRTTPAASA